MIARIGLFLLRAVRVWFCGTCPGCGEDTTNVDTIKVGKRGWTWCLECHMEFRAKRR